MKKSLLVLRSSQHLYKFEILVSDTLGGCVVKGNKVPTVIITTFGNIISTSKW